MNTPSKELQTWARSRGFQLVLDPYRGGYAEGFEPNREYQFTAPTWTEPRVMKLSEQSPFFNVAGLMFRSPAP